MYRFEICSIERRGFGFDILRNGKPYIHQPFIPCIAGRLTCPTESLARKIASLILQRLSTANFRYLISRKEVDSLAGSFNIATTRREPEHVQHIGSAADQISRYEYASCSQQGIEYLPTLPDMPIKNAWHTLMPLPFGKRAGLMSFAIGTRIYMGGGVQREESADDFWCFDSQAETWTCLASLPGGRRVSGIAFAVNGNGYLGWGAISKNRSEGFASDFYEYRPAENCWLRKHDLPAPARKDASVFVINNTAYAGLGYASHYLNDFYRYDTLKDRWTRCRDFPGGELSSALGVSDGKKGFIIAGNHVPQLQHFVYEYDSSADQWIQHPDLPGPSRYCAAGAAIDSGLIMAGAGSGAGGELQFRDFYGYHTGSQKWEALAAYPISNRGNAQIASASVNGTVYMGGGFNGNYLSGWNAYEYYYNVNTDTGMYREEAATTIRGNNSWSLFQECAAENCFAAVAIRLKNSGSAVYYQRLLLDTAEELPSSAALPANASWILPRRFALREKSGSPQAGQLRFFYPAREIEKAFCYCGQKRGTIYTLQDCRILVYQCEEPDLNWQNNRHTQGHWQVIQPVWYRYGPAGRILVAEMNTAAITGEYYLVLPQR